jgi:CheY-like chemotaxis protein
MARILLVEDDQDVREMLVDSIAHSGHSVTAAQNGDAALVLLDKGEFDLLITDVRMPGAVNGFALASIARRLRPTLRIICATGYADAREEPGTCDLVLRKPFSARKIVDLIAHLLG